MLRARDEHIDPTRSRTLRLFRRWVPMTDAYHGQRFVVRRGGVLLATPLLAVLVLVEVTDIIFAVDSIPAIFAVTDEPFLVFTANAFAVLGLRAMYFLLADLVHRFVYLKVGLALVLVWVGIKMILKIDVLYVPTWVSLTVIVTILAVALAASLRATRGQGRRSVAAPVEPPFRFATAAELDELEPVWRRPRPGRPVPSAEDARDGRRGLRGTGRRDDGFRARSRGPAATRGPSVDVPDPPRPGPAGRGRGPHHPGGRHRHPGGHQRTSHPDDPGRPGGVGVPHPRAGGPAHALPGRAPPPAAPP